MISGEHLGDKIIKACPGIGFDLASTDRTVILTPHRELTASEAEGFRDAIREHVPAWVGIQIHSRPPTTMTWAEALGPIDGALGIPRPAPMPSFVKLYQGNDWGSNFLALSPGPVPPDLTWGAKEYGVTLAPEIDVRWPDGSITREKVVHESQSVSIQDHGSPYRTTSATAYVEASFRGALVRVRVVDLEVSEACITKPVRNR